MSFNRKPLLVSTATVIAVLLIALLGPVTTPVTVFADGNGGDTIARGGDTTGGEGSPIGNEDPNQEEIGAYELIVLLLRVLI